MSFSPGIPKYGLYAPLRANLLSSAAAFIYPFFCLDHGYCLQREIMIFVSCPVFYIWIEEILQKYPDMYVPPAAPSLTNYYLLYFFGFNDISKWALSMSLLLLLGQTLSIKYVEIKRHMLYRTPLYNTTWLSNHSVAHNIFSR